jgi:hypothetical protein
MQQDNATQTGAESLSPAHAGRNAALAQIASQVNAGYQEDLASFDETTGQILPKQAEPEKPAQETQAAAEQGEQQEEQQESQQATQQTPAQAEELETIVVDGQQVQVKRSQLFDAGKRTLQKEATADKRLQEATELYRRAQAYEQALRQHAQPSQDAGQFSQSPSEDATNGNGLQPGRQATPDIGTLVDERLWLHDANKAAQRFKAEFKDIAEDPMLMRLAGQLEDERLAQVAAEGLPPGDPWDAYRKHGETIRARFGKPQTVQPAVSEDRQERKRSTTTVVGAGARMQASQPKQPLTTAEIIEQQRIARRQGRQHQPAR